MEIETNKNPIFEGNKEGISRLRLLESKLNNILICPICNKIFWNPQECGECGIVFCEPCLKRSLIKKESCPKCGKGAEFRSSKSTIRHLEILLFSCSNYQCTETMGYFDLPNHLCPYDKLSCEIRICTWKGERKSLPGHLENCPCEFIQCPNDCGTMRMRKEMNLHRDECQFEEVRCPNSCGFSSARFMMQEHIGICPQEKLVCCYDQRGCKVRPVRSRFTEHTEKCEFRPKIMKCKHQVSLKDVSEHKKNCPDYLFKCQGCSVFLPRKDLSKHKCLAFLYQEMEHLKTENKKMNEHIEYLEHSLTCKYFRCEDSRKNEAEVILKRYECKKCKKEVCKRFIKLSDEGNYCSDCLNTQLPLTAVSATSTYREDKIENILEENGKEWGCRRYEEDERKSADENIIFKIKDDKQAIISRLFIYVNNLYPYGAMKVYVGDSLNFINQKLPGNYEFKKNENENVKIIVDISNIQARFIKIRLKEIIDDPKTTGKGYFSLVKFKTFGVICN